MAYTPEERKAAQRASKLKFRPLTPITPYTPEESRAARTVARLKWAKKNPEKVLAKKAAWVAKNPEKMRAQYLRRKQKQLTQNTVFRLKSYGLTPVDYARLLRRQKGVCAICSRPSKIKLAVDHCHSSRRVRGLLCGSCNRGIGLLQDNPNILIMAAKYLFRSAAESLECNRG